MTKPTDDELDAVIAEYRTRIYPQDMHPRFERAIMRAAIAKWGTPPAVAGEPYSIDIDPQGIRALVADAITGALAFGAQGTNAPPDGHWLAPFWAARAAQKGGE